MSDTSFSEKMQVFNTVSFQVYPSGILGTKFDNVLIMAILDAASCVGIIDPPALHANVYPTLPPGAVDDYTKYPYYKIKKPDGTITCIGRPWIREETVKVVTQQNLQIVLNNISIDDVARWREIVALNHGSDFTITVK